jgi:hypothetical protein
MSEVALTDADLSAIEKSFEEKGDFPTLFETHFANLIAEVRRLKAEMDAARAERDKEWATVILQNSDPNTLVGEFVSVPENAALYLAEQRQYLLEEMRERCAKAIDNDHLIEGSIGPLFSMGWHEASKAHAAAIRAIPT